MSLFTVVDCHASDSGSGCSWTPESGRHKAANQTRTRRIAAGSEERMGAGTPADRKSENRRSSKLSRSLQMERAWVRKSS